MVLLFTEVWKIIYPVLLPIGIVLAFMLGLFLWSLLSLLFIWIFIQICSIVIMILFVIWNAIFAQLVWVITLCIQGNEFARSFWQIIRDAIDSYFVYVNAFLCNLRISVLNVQHRGSNTVESWITHTQYLGVALCWWGIYAIARIGPMPDPPISPENLPPVDNEPPPVPPHHPPVPPHHPPVPPHLNYHPDDEDENDDEYFNENEDF
jgi:hypothetical protein